MNLENMDLSNSVIDNRDIEKSFHWPWQHPPRLPNENAGRQGVEPPEGPLAMPDKETIMDSIMKQRADPYVDNTTPQQSFLEAIAGALSRVPQNMARTIRSSWY